MTLPALSLAVVGADHPNKRGPTRRFEIALCKPGEPVELVREPKNPADPRAVAVFSCRGVQLGYLTAERCGWIGSMISEGRPIAAIFQRSTSFGALVRAGFDGVAPGLPDISDTSGNVPPDAGSGFWPDEIFPDD